MKKKHGMKEMLREMLKMKKKAENVTFVENGKHDLF